MIDRRPTVRRVIVRPMIVRRPIVRVANVRLVIVRPVIVRVANEPNEMIAEGVGVMTAMIAMIGAVDGSR